MSNRKLAFVVAYALVCSSGCVSAESDFRHEPIHVLRK